MAVRALSPGSCSPSKIPPLVTRGSQRESQVACEPGAEGTMNSSTSPKHLQGPLLFQREPSVPGEQLAP